MSDKLAIIREFLRGNTEPQTLLAEVISVDEAERTCVAEMDETEYEDVRLYSVVKADLKGFVMIPKVGSKVLVSRIGNSNEMFVTMFSEVDKMLLSIDNTKVVIGADGIVFNEGENGGLVKVVELEENLKSLKTFVEAMHSALPTSFSAILKSTAADGGLGASAYDKLMTDESITIGSMNNDKIKH